MEKLQDVITLFSDFSTELVVIVLVWKIVDLFEIPQQQRRIIYGGALLSLFSVIYIFEHIWIEWISHTPTTAKYFKYSIGSVWWIALAYTTSHLVHYFVWRGILGKSGGDSAAPKLIRDFIDAVLYMVTLMIIVRFVFGQPITGLVATSGALAVVLGLSAQATLGGVFAGLSINLSDSFEKGDTLVISNVPSGIKDVRGVIVDMNWRNVTILTKFNNLLIMPNSLMATSAITNYSKPEPRRMLEMWILIPYSVSPQTAKDLIGRAIDHSNNIVKDPKPKVQLANFEDKGIRYRLEIHTLRPGSDSIRDDILTAIWYEFNRIGVTLHPIQLEENLEKPTTTTKEENNQSIIGRLRKIEILNTLTDEEIQLLATRVQKKVFGAPERIVIEGEKGDSLFLIEKGKVSINIKQKDGSNLKVAELAEGSFFGEMALLTGELRKATVAAINEVSLFEISKADIFPILQQRAEILDDISRILATRQVEIASKSAAYDDSQRNKESEIASTADKLRLLMRNFFIGTE